MAKKPIYRAGLVPYILHENQTIEILTMKPSNPKFGGDDFQIAKGKIEEDETAKDAALREAHEELGLHPKALKKVYELGMFLGKSTFFVGKIKTTFCSGEVITKYELEEPHFETGETKWMTTEEFIKFGRRIHVPIVKAAVRLIKEKEGLF